MGLADTAELAVRINLSGNASTGIDKLQRKVNGLGKSVGRMGKGFGQVGVGLARAGTVVGAAVVGGLVAAAKAAIDYEDAFAGVRKTVDASESELATLSDQFRTMAKEIPISAVEFARLGEIAGALGIDTAGIDEFTRTTALLGVTTNLTADQAADALGRIGNILNLSADDYDNFGSALVNLGNKGASMESEIIEITKRFAAAGKQAGLSAPEILAFAEATASFTGLEQEAAGSSLSRLTGILTKVVAGGGDKFKLLNKIVGVDFRKALDKDAGGALLGFLKGLGKLDKYERASALKTLGLDSVFLRQLLGGLVDNIEDVEISLDNADKGWNGNFLNEEAAEKFKTIAQQLILLKNNLVDAGITIGTAFLPALGRATTKLINFLKVDGNQSQLKAIGVDIGRAIDGIQWDRVLQGARDFVGVLKGAVGVAKTMWDGFNALPDNVKAAAAALLVLNKASGGMVAAGIGNIVGGLAETIARAIGSRIPVVGALFAQPVFVTNWPLGGIGGVPVPGAGSKLGALGNILKVAVVGAVVVEGVSLWLQSMQEVADKNNAIKTEYGGKVTAEEIAAVKYYEGTPAYQQEAFKRLGRKPSADDYASALRKRDASKTPPAVTANARLGRNLPLSGADLAAKNAPVLPVAIAEVTAAARETQRETTRGATLMAATARTGSASIVSAIYANRPDIDVVVNVSGTTVTKTITKKERYGPSTGSRNRDAVGPIGLLTGGR